MTPWLKNQGIYYFKPRGGPYVSRKGIADYILCIKGRFIALEIKADEGKMSEYQKVEQANVKKAGGAYFIVKPETWLHTKEMLLRLNAFTSSKIYQACQDTECPECGRTLAKNEFEICSKCHVYFCKDCLLGYVNIQSLLRICINCAALGG